MGDSFEGLLSKPTVASRDDASSKLSSEATMKTMPNMVVVCTDSSCTPFSTKESGDTDSSQFVESNFRTFDKDHDKALDKDELKGWSSQFTKDSPVQKMTDIVIEKFDDVAQLAQEEGDEKPKGITREDFAALNKLKSKDPKDLSKEEAALVKALDLSPDKKKVEKEEEKQKNESNEGLFDKFLDF